MNLVGVTYFLSLQGFMEDEGRQRTTKYISHKCVFTTAPLVFLPSCSVCDLGVSLRCASGSDRLQLFVKEQERNKLLCLSDPQLSSNPPSAPATPSTSESALRDDGKTPAQRRKPKAGKRGRSKDVEEDASVRTEDAAEEDLHPEVKPGRRSRARGGASERGAAEDAPPADPATQPSPGEQLPFRRQLLIFLPLLTVFLLSIQTKLPAVVNPPLLHLNQLVILSQTPVDQLQPPFRNGPTSYFLFFFLLFSEPDPVEEENEPSSCPTGTEPHGDGLNPDDNNLVEVKAKVGLKWLDVLRPVFRMSRLVSNQRLVPLLQAAKGEKYFERSHQTYRLLRRKNLIVEAVRNFKVIEGLFQSVDERLITLW